MRYISLPISWRKMDDSASIAFKAHNISEPWMEWVEFHMQNWKTWLISKLGIEGGTKEETDYLGCYYWWKELRGARQRGSISLSAPIKVQTVLEKGILKPRTQTHQANKLGTRTVWRKKKYWPNRQSVSIYSAPRSSGSRYLDREVWRHPDAHVVCIQQKPKPHRPATFTDRIQPTQLTAIPRTSGVLRNPAWSMDQIHGQALRSMG